VGIAVGRKEGIDDGREVGLEVGRAETSSAEIIRFTAKALAAGFHGPDAKIWTCGYVGRVGEMPTVLTL